MGAAEAPAPEGDLVPIPAVPDAQWLWENEPCRAACPVHTDAGAYVTAIAEGRFEEAYLIARAPNPFPSVCGRVCAAPCERACRRGSVDAPVSIRALKRFVTERFGVESFAANTMWHAAHGEVPPAGGPSVGVIGGGPAGLAAACDLRLAGHPVTIYEAQDRLGGMMVLGIPEYRLPRALIAREIEAIVELGIDVETNARIGEHALDHRAPRPARRAVPRGRHGSGPRPRSAGPRSRRRAPRRRVPPERESGVPGRAGRAGRGRRRGQRRVRCGTDRAARRGRRHGSTSAGPAHARPRKRMPAGR